MSLSVFEIDLKAEEDGVWFPYGEMEFLIARAGNDEFKKYYNKAEKRAYGNQIRSNPKFKRDEKKDLELYIETVAYTCLNNWKNVAFEDEGEPLEFSHELANEIMQDKKYRPFTDFVLKCAMDEEQYYVQQIEEDEKK